MLLATVTSPEGKGSNFQQHQAHSVPPIPVSSDKQCLGAMWRLPQSSEQQAETFASTHHVVASRTEQRTKETAAFIPCPDAMLLAQPEDSAHVQQSKRQAQKPQESQANAFQLLQTPQSQKKLTQAADS